MQGPRETAIAITQLVMLAPSPLPVQLRGMATVSAGELIALLAAELADAGIKIDRIELPTEWCEQVKLRVEDQAFRECLRPIQKSDCQILIYRKA